MMNELSQHLLVLGHRREQLLAVLAPEKQSYQSQSLRNRANHFYEQPLCAQHAIHGFQSLKELNLYSTHG